jgi:phosphoglycerate kinase
MDFKTIDDVDVSNKTVFIRADLNCPVDENKTIEKSARLIEHAKTIKELSDKNAKIVILAHQGREGRDDFINLLEHAKMLSDEVGKEVTFIADVCGEPAQNAIKGLQPSQILLLDNVRFIKSEKEYAKTHKSEIVENLSPLCDIFCLDGFSVSHREQASVVGFKGCEQIIAGRVMQKELKSLSKITEDAKRPVVFLMGGAKPSDSIPIMKSWLEQGKVDHVLCGGALANLMLAASAKEIGGSLDFLKKVKAIDFLGEASALYEKYPNKIHIPKDILVDAGEPKTINTADLPSEYPILDIGAETAEEYSRLILSAQTIIMNGPMGVYEKDGFENGTKKVLQAVADSKGFSVLGGGHTLSAIKKFNHSTDQFGYISLSGKALIEYLSGDKLPGVELLKSRA